MEKLKIDIIKQIDFTNKFVALRSDGIVLVNINSTEDVEIKDVKEVVSALEKIGNGKKFPLLIVTQKYTLPSPDARAYIAKAESDPYAIAEAYVIQSLSQKLVGNVYLKFNKPARPTYIFNSEEKAVEWLKTFL